ncbi:MAG: lysophospholipid acyltransferase family protein [Planctomycetota bacterium]|jgi:1-acyl-sn-glycerol-3-phosphate acyltransferase
MLIFACGRGRLRCSGIVFLCGLRGILILRHYPGRRFCPGQTEGVFRNKRYLIIFPEAHRSRTGKAGRFHSGAFKLAIELKVPILPLCMSGTGTLLPPDRKWLRPARIVMRLLDPVFPEEFTGERSHIQMCKQVRAKMIEAVEQMEDNRTDAN